MRLVFALIAALALLPACAASAQASEDILHFRSAKEAEAEKAEKAALRAERLRQHEEAYGKLEGMGAAERDAYLAAEAQRLREMEPQERQSFIKSREAYFNSLPAERRDALKAQMAPFRQVRQENLTEKMKAMTPEEREAYIAEKRGEFSDKAAAKDKPAKKRAAKKKKKKKPARKNYNAQNQSGGGGLNQ